MGAKDIITKDYTEDCIIFADAFNQLLYKGETVIDPTRLKPLDSAMLGVPYGTDGAEAPVQKFRDGLKYLTAMEDEVAVYLLMGLENQSEVNYAMPVKDMLYDALQYATQVEKAAKSHREAQKKEKEASDGTAHHRQITGAEYLSGFHKDDRLIPIITLVLYFNAEEWDGPMSLHDMMAVKDTAILSFVSDYKVNLIAPAGMTDEEIDRFGSSLREVMLFIKYSKDKTKLYEILEKDERFKRVERKAARVIGTVTGTKLEVEEEEKEIDMCQAIKEMMEDAAQDGMKQGIQQGMQQGMQQGAQEIAKRMLAEGSVPIAYIAQITNLSEEEVRMLDTGK